jgi:hypothetical protein
MRYHITVCDQHPCKRRACMVPVCRLTNCTMHHISQCGIKAVYHISAAQSGETSYSEQFAQILRPLCCCRSSATFRGLPLLLFNTLRFGQIKTIISYAEHISSSVTFFRYSLSKTKMISHANGYSTKSVRGLASDQINLFHLELF